MANISTSEITRVVYASGVSSHFTMIKKLDCQWTAMAAMNLEVWSVFTAYWPYFRSECKKIVFIWKLTDVGSFKHDLPHCKSSPCSRYFRFCVEKLLKMYIFAFCPTLLRFERKVAWIFDFVLSSSLAETRRKQRTQVSPISVDN